jgi:hypothetical protein
MNERIQKLAEQAGLHDFVFEAMGIGDELEKFAELIVKECGQTLVDNTPAVQLHGNCYNQGYDQAMNDCIHYIYEHFGLEE